MGNLNLKRLNLLVWALGGIVLLTLLVYVKYLQKYANTLEVGNASLAANLRSSLEVHGSKVVYKYRYKDKVVEVIKYLPPEGSITTTTPQPGTVHPHVGILQGFLNNIFSYNFTNPETGETITIKRAGFCLEPALAGLVGREVSVGLQSRLVFINRWGTGVGVSSAEYGYVFVDRRIDDFIPIMKNTTIGAHAGYGIDTTKYYGGNIALFF